MLYLNRTLIIVRPKQKFVNWINGVSGEQLTLGDVLEDLSTYLVPELVEESEFYEFLYKYYKLIFEDHLDGWYADPETWPKLSFEMFQDWFSIEQSSMIADLTDEPLCLDEL